MAARARLLDENGTCLGHVEISRLPGRTDRLDDGDLVTLAEGSEYRFALEMPGWKGPLRLEPGTELFSFDDESQRQGRLKPREHVGRIAIQVRDDETGAVAAAQIDVAPTKLEEEREYHQMLSDIADVANDALLQGFAPASLALSSDAARRPELLYQQFAFLAAQLQQPELRDAVALILAQPHRAWRREVSHQAPGQPLPGSSHVARALARSGPRVPTNGRLRAPSVPEVVERSRTEATYDSVPNRFVKHALSRWRAIAQHLLDALGPPGGEPGPVRRGRDVATNVIRQLDQWLAAPFFREVGPLTVFPLSNQVLQKQEGYRQVLRVFALTEIGARLALDWDVDDAFGASQRNVATLYEYWAFLQLADAVGEACGERKTERALAVSSDQLSLGFRQGAASCIAWEHTVLERHLVVELYFNRTFARSSHPSVDSSWSRPMRPDCSLRIRPVGPVPAESDPSDLDVWLHFDAKYRVEGSPNQFDPTTADSPAEAAEAEETERVTRSKREDLLKMHAYRDAIRRSAGAYVLYPGSDTAPPFQQYQEVLPGIGAFVLRPRKDDPTGREALVDFVQSAMEHVADRATQHERERYWQGLIRGRARDEIPSDRPLPRLSTPPRDALVLCGYVRSADHLAWIQRTWMYNVRADSRTGALSPDAAELRSGYFVLYGPTIRPHLLQRSGAWFVQSREQLERAGYPRPRGVAYLCAPVEPSQDTCSWLSGVDFEALRSSAGLPKGHPFSVTWADLAMS